MYVDPLKHQRNVRCTQRRNVRAKSEMQGPWQTKQTRRVATTAIITKRNTEREREREGERERLAEDIEALALSNDRAHLRAANGPTATRSALDSQWRGVCRSVKTLVRGRYLRIQELLPGKNPAA